MAQKKTDVIEIPALEREEARIRIIGVTPFFQHRMAEGSKLELLAGGRKKTAAEKVKLKHDPQAEFVDCLELLADGPTAIGLKATAVKGAMCTAAIETAGVTKTGIQRLVFVPSEYVPLYGVPQIRLDVVRNSDMKKTPDIRSRPFFPKWGAELDLWYVRPQLNLTSIVTLLANAGVMIGVGDFRQEKGRGAFGCFRVLGDSDADEAEWAELVKNGGREAQIAAIKEPQPANDETLELLALLEEERARRS